jgi:hypothetical protein
MDKAEWRHLTRQLINQLSALLSPALDFAVTQRALLLVA